MGLRSALCSVLATIALCGGIGPHSTVVAAEPTPLVREIFVPFKDLDAILESQPRRVLLSREQYEELLKKAKKNPETHAPQAAAILGAEYSGTIEEERARWTGKLAVEVLEDGLHALPLDLSGVSLRSAALDGKPAAIGRADDSRLVLLVEGKGRHELVLEMVSPLETTAARQALSFRLPYPAAAKFFLTVPGDVEVQSGATVVSRVVDAAARVTRFELLPPRGDVNLQMTLNSRLVRKQRAVVARSVLVDEITGAYERLHATVSLAVLHQPVDQFRFVAPAGFEVTEVVSPLLARWAVEKEAGRQVLDVRLREPTVQTVVLNLSASRTPPPLDKWVMPRLEPLDVVGQMAVVGLVVEERLNAESIASTGLIGIDTSVLTQAIPPSVLRDRAADGNGPGAPTIRPVVAYYAPQGDFSLSARFTKPPVETEVVSNVLLILEDRGLSARGLFVLTPKVEKLFGLDFSVPAGWHVTRVTTAEGKPLDFERFDAAGAPHPNPLPKGEGTPGRIRVRLPQGVAPGQNCRILFQAESTPAGWLAEPKAESRELETVGPASRRSGGAASSADGRDARPTGDLPAPSTGKMPVPPNPPPASRPAPPAAFHIELPVFAVAGAARDVGAVAVDARSDLVVRPEVLKQLMPLDEKEKQSYGLAGVATSLAYRYESQPYQATFAVERARPRLTARTFSFLRVEPDALIGHYEVIFRVDEARTRTLSLLLPASTPAALGIQGMDGVRVKEFTSEPAGDGRTDWKSVPQATAPLRRWNVLLEEPRGGAVRLAVDFQQPLAAAKGQSQEVLKAYSLPVVQADGVAYQSGLVAVEGSAELDVQVQTDDRRVHVGELVDADYQPGRRLLGVFGFVGPPATDSVRIDVSRNPAYALQPAIVQRATLTTRLSATGASVTEAVFSLRNKDLYLEVELPPGSEAWAVLVDDQPVKPQRQDSVLLVNLPAADPGKGSTRALKITYQTPVGPVGMIGEVELPAPKLRLHAEGGGAAKGIEVPLADCQWHVYAPNGYQVVRSRGTVVAELEPPEEPAILNVAKAACGLAILPFYRVQWELPEFRGRMMDAKKSAAKTAAVPAAGATAYHMSDDARYDAAKSREQTVGVYQSPDNVWDRLVLPGDKLSANAGEAGLAGAKSAPKADMPDRPGKASGKAKSESKAGESRNRAVPPSAPVELRFPSGRPAESPPVTAAPRSGRVVVQEEETAELGKFERGLTDMTSGYTVSKPVWTRGWQGRRSLKIDLAKDEEGMVTFQSLGVEPRLVITVANRPRFRMLGWATALAVALCGLAISRRSGRCKVRYLVFVATVATLLPLVPGWGELAVAGNLAVYTAAALAVYYIVIALLAAICRAIFRKKPAAQAAVLATSLLAMGLLLCSPAFAQQGRTELNSVPPEAKTGPYVIQVVEPVEPVKVPADALVLPYDPDSTSGIQAADRVLVPYDKYVELWNRAYPDKRLETKAPPLPYGLAGASYTATLQQAGMPVLQDSAGRSTIPSYEDSLRVEGQLEIDVLAEQPVTIPLGLAGGVLARAELDGQPARLSLVTGAGASNSGPGTGDAALGARVQGSGPRTENSQPGSSSLAPSPQPLAPHPSLLTLLVSGKGRHRLVLEVRMKLERTGGWRVMEGALPAAPATAVSIVVPEAQTEVRLGEVADRRSYDIEKAGQRIETALGPGGRIHLQWRPKVSEGEVDRSLTAQSAAVLDVQEDGLRVLWQVTLQFRRGQRESFTFYVPTDYLVEKVEGGNVRGWEVRKEEKRQVVEATLLKPARESERLVLRLWRAGRVGEGALAEFDAPAVAVADAAMDAGELAIRRSPLLEVRTLAAPRLSRTEVSAPGGNAGALAGIEDSPLGVRPYEAYRYSSAPFSLRLAARPIAGHATAQVQSVLKIAEFERTLESRIKLEVQDRPVHRIECLLPDGLKLDQVTAPGQFQWTVTPHDHPVDGARRMLLTVYLSGGLAGDVPVVLRGTLRQQSRTELKSVPQQGPGSSSRSPNAQPPAPSPSPLIPIPNLEVLNVLRQQGDVAVQVDPGVEAKAEGLTNCESVLLERVRDWLQPQQLEATAIVLHYERPDYRGAVRLVPRKPIVSCQTVTNVRVTQRAIEETILLEFTIQQAGIRQLAFMLPDWMSDSRFQVPMLRQKTVGQPKDGMVPVRIELQDPLMQRLQVLVQNDRLLTAGTHEAPIPIVRTADATPVEVTRQFVAIQSAGRDEVIVQRAAGLEPLGSEQEAWRALRELLGGGVVTKAFLVRGGSGQAKVEPKLQFATQVRKAVETGGARIWLAETDLVCDANGAYRARQVYHLDNTINQFLQIGLPEGATLWTAVVAGEPVKPVNGTDIEVAGDGGREAGDGRGGDSLPATHHPTPDTGHLSWVRIPLVKTAAGDRDYEVVLKYGGQMPPLGAIDKLRFPLMQTLDIKVEQSQVRLHLPQTHRFFQFGGTMSPVAEDDLLAGRVAYHRRQTERLLDTVRQGDPFARTLAANNLKQLGIVGKSSSMSVLHANENVRQELAREEEVRRQAEGEVGKLDRAPAGAETDDNRSRMNKRVLEQRATRAQNQVQGWGWNFDADLDMSAPAGAENTTQLNPQWLQNSQLANGTVAGRRTVIESQLGAGGKDGARPRKDAEARKEAAGVEFGFAELQTEADRGRTADRKGLAKALPADQPSAVYQGGLAPTFQPPQAGTEVQRYQQRLAEQAAQQPPLGGAGPATGGGAKPAGEGYFDYAEGRVGGIRAGIRDGARGPASTTPPPPPPAPAFAHGAYRGVSSGLGLSTGKMPLPPAAGLQSLDFEIPLRGQVFAFTTPGGDAAVTARAVSGELLDGVVRGALVLLAAAVVLWISRIASAAWFRWFHWFGWLDSRAGVLLLICVGLLVTLLGFVVIGLALLVVGIVMAIGRLRRQRPAAAGTQS